MELKLNRLFERGKKQVEGLSFGVLDLYIGAVQRLADAGHQARGRVTREEAVWQSRVDALTNMPNRRQFFYQLDRLITSEEAPKKLIFVHIDTVGFGKINAEYGYGNGDHLLRVIGWMFSEAFHSPTFSDDSTNIARFGGDEFVGVLPTGRPLNLDYPLFEGAIDFDIKVPDSRTDGLTEGFEINFQRVMHNMEEGGTQCDHDVYEDLKSMTTDGLTTAQFKIVAAGEIDVTPESTAESLFADFSRDHGLGDTVNVRSESRK